MIASAVAAAKPMNQPRVMAFNAPGQKNRDAHCVPFDFLALSFSAEDADENNLPLVVIFI
jgi:hypothetical protein